MNQDYKHPITPPPELVGQWQDESPETQIAAHIQYLVTRAAQWGADQELAATLGLMETLNIRGVDYIRNVRRPKPPSLKEQALETLQRLSKDGYPCNYQEDSDWDTIRRALEQLPDNE
jgi:hypothetical protein